MEAIIGGLSALWDRVVLWQVIGPWERGLSVWFGKWVTERGPGFYLRMPLFQEYFVEDIRRDVNDGQYETFDTKDNVTVAVSIALDYEITSVRDMWLNVKDHGNSLLNLVEGLIGDYICENTYEDCTIPAMRRAILPILRRRCQDWGVKIHNLYFTTCTRSIPLRLISD